MCIYIKRKRDTQKASCGLKDLHKMVLNTNIIHSIYNKNMCKYQCGYQWWTPARWLDEQTLYSRRP